MNRDFESIGLHVGELCDHPHVSNTITVYALHDSGPGLAGTVPLGGVSEVLKIGGQICKAMGEKTGRMAARTFIADALRRGQHLKEKGAEQIIVTARAWRRRSWQSITAVRCRARPYAVG
jgi:hypothetical protein